MPRARPQGPPERGRGGLTWKQQGAPPPAHTHAEAAAQQAGSRPRPPTSPARLRHGTAAAGVAGSVGLLIQASHVRHRRVLAGVGWAAEGCQCDKHTSRKASQLCSASGRGAAPRPANDLHTGPPWTPAPTQPRSDAPGRLALLPRLPGLPDTHLGFSRTSSWTQGS